jgi:RNA polymerase sigma-70 factor (ECF subfamily)
MSVCYRYTHQKELAEEMLNMGYLKILNNLGKYDDTMPFKAWVRRIMINTLIDEYRKNKSLKSKISYVEEYYDTESFSETNNAVKKLSADEILSIYNATAFNYQSPVSYTGNVYIQNLTANVNITDGNKQCIT